MPWETKFDITLAIDNATKVFWAKGYKSASLTDLLEAMDINKGSFYNTFHSKKNLFHKALLHYDYSQRIPALEAVGRIEDPIDSISTIFDLFIDASINDPDKKGCFIVNTALDLPSHDVEVKEIVQNSFNEISLFFENQLKKGISINAIDVSLNTKETSKGLMALLISIRVMARGAMEKTDLEVIKSQAMKLIAS